MGAISHGCSQLGRLFGRSGSRPTGASLVAPRDRPVELYPHVLVLADWSIRRHEQQAARHAEMHEPYEAASDVGEKVLRTTRDALDLPPHQRAQRVLIHDAAQARLANLDAADA